MIHQCTKCKASYSDNDVEAYLCAPCLQERKSIAAEVDRQQSAIPRTKVMSDLQAYENAPKFRGFMIVK